MVLSIEPRQPPWQGAVCLRIPDWSRRFESTGDLYQPRPSQKAGSWMVHVNGREIQPAALRRGYLVLQREWEQGDVIELSLPMPILPVVSHPQVVVNRDRIALQRGPIVYCIEAVDHGGQTRDIVLPCAASLQAEHRSDLLSGVTVVIGEARRQGHTGPEKERVPLIAIPYAVWGNREIGEMDVWLAEDTECER